MCGCASPGCVRQKEGYPLIEGIEMSTALGAEACSSAQDTLLKLRVGIEEVIQVCCLRHGTPLVVCSCIGLLVDCRDLEVALCFEV